MIIVVPKSGCNMINPIINPSRAKNDIKRFRSLYKNQDERYRITVNFATSVGCNENSPRLIQRRAPYTVVPIPGIRTRTSNITVTIKAGNAK